LIRLQNFLLFFLLCLIPVPLFGSDPLPPSSEDPGARWKRLTLEELMEIEVASVYGPSKFYQKVTEAPSSITIITGEEIRKFGWRTLAEVLRSIAGVFFTYDRTYSYLGVRGFGRPGDYNTRVLLLIDGQRINENIYESLLLGNEFILDLELIDRIEFSRGPGSSLYGSNAFLATVNIFTRRGRELKGVETEVSSGSQGTYKGRVTYGNLSPKGLETVFSASYYHSEGKGELYFKEYDDPSTHFGIASHVDQDRYGRLFAALSFGDFIVQGAWNERKKTVPTASFGTDFNHPGNRVKDERAYINLKYRRLFFDGTELFARLSYDRYRYQGDYLYSGEMNKDYALGEWLTLESRLSGVFRERHRWVAGWEFSDNFRQTQKNYYEESGRVLLDDERTGRNWGVYLQDEISLGKGLLFNGGLRYDHYPSFGGTWHPRLALIFRPMDRTGVKFLYGTAFRAPSVFERYYHDQGISAKPNPTLKPEKISTYEGVVEQWERYWGGRLSLYYYRINDLISQVLDPEDGLLVYKNIDRVVAKGVETEWEWRGPRGVTARFGYAYQRAEDRTTGQELTNSPRHLARLGVNIPLWGDKVCFSPEWSFLGPRKNPSGEKAEGFLIMNFTVLLQKVIPDLEITASVYNLGDRFYADPVGAEHRQECIAQDGRTFRLKIIYRF